MSMVFIKRDRGSMIKHYLKQDIHNNVDATGRLTLKSHLTQTEKYMLPFTSKAMQERKR
jgi:predicted PolB exonuclease-like 3'-5' exonuclease